MNLQSTDFELLGVPAQFAQDAARLDAAWKALQREVHPDKFAGQGAAAQRLAMQWSARVNEAYQRLKDPLKRAAYLCALHGQPVNAESNTAMPPEFLMQQMQWREALEDAASAQELAALADEVQQAQADAQAACAAHIDQQRDFAQAAHTVRRLMFLQKFADDLRKRMHAAMPPLAPIASLTPLASVDAAKDPGDAA